MELLSCCLDARAVQAFRVGDYAAAYEWELQVFELLHELDDPDLVHDVYLSTVPTAAAIGNLDEARRLAAQLDDHVAELTPHHRVHGVGSLIEVEELAGDWAAIATLEPEVERRVRENRDTPCIRNARSLLLCAIATEPLGRPA